MVELFKIGPEESIDTRESFLRDLSKEHTQTGVLLQTCNRVEWYHGKGVIEEDTAEHLFRVVSGLESSIIGETAIVNQVKTAYQETAQKSRLDKSIHKLFQTAFFVGKRVRKETGISEGAMSHSQAVVKILNKIIPDLKGATITLIGVNKMNEKIIQFLLKKGASTIFLGNRTYYKAKELAEKYNSTALSLNSLPKTLVNTDVLISATSAPHYIIKKETPCPSTPILIFDLAVPRDVDPQLGNFPNVTLYNIDMIEKHLTKNVKVRQEKMVLAEKIINKEVQIFLKNQSYGKSGK